MGTLFELYVHNNSTASFAAGSTVVVAIDRVVRSVVVEVFVGLTSSHSYESHGHPPGQFS